jgi:thioredoxin 1
MKALLLATLLFASTAFATITEVTEGDLNKIMKDGKGVVVIDVYATWCGPCKIMAKTLEEVDKHYAGKIKFVKMDADKNPSIKNIVPSYPFVLVLKDGKGVVAMPGATDDPKLVISLLDKVLAAK